MSRSRAYSRPYLEHENMLDILMTYLPTVIGAVLAALALVAAWGIRKLNLKKELEDALVAFVQRTVDKAGDRLAIALKPDADGVVRLSKEELSELRQAAFDLLKAELKGPLAKMAIKWGEDRLKGLIGKVLKNNGVVAK